MKGLKIGIVAISVFSVASVIAQNGGQTENQRGEKVFAKMDTDSDGAISKAEFEAFKEGKTNKNGEPVDGAKRFEKLDANSDGKITEAEFKEAQENKPQRAEGPKDGSKMFEKMDSDKNNLVDFSEFKAFHENSEHQKENSDLDRRFKKLDVNNDGNIDKAEMAEVAEKRQENEGQNQQAK